MQSSTQCPARRWLTEADKESVNKLRLLLGEMVLESRHFSCRESHLMSRVWCNQQNAVRVRVVGFNKKKYQRSV
jgi:hypothetical protein